jgi:transposase-like protein
MRATPCRDHPRELREAALQRYLQSDSSYREVSEEFDVNMSTLRSWVSNARRVKKQQGKQQGKSGRTEEVAAKEKLRLMVEARGLSGEARGEFLRRHGLRDGDLERWERAALMGLGDNRLPPAAAERVKRAERKAAKTMARLKEAEALLDLQKKVQALWRSSDEVDESAESYD